MTEAFVWWLMPAEPLKGRLQDCIRSISDRHEGSPNFEPHITLSLPQRLEQYKDEALSWEESICIPAMQFRVEIGTTFTQSVLLRISAIDTPALWQLRKHLVGQEEEDIHKDRFPHLSLAYCGDNEERQKIADSISLDSLLQEEDCIFDAIQCMKIRLPVSDAEDVRQWSVLKRIQLR